MQPGLRGPWPSQGSAPASVMCDGLMAQLEAWLSRAQKQECRAEDMEWFKDVCKRCENLRAHCQDVCLSSSSATTKGREVETSKSADSVPDDVEQKLDENNAKLEAAIKAAEEKAAIKAAEE